MKFDGLKLITGISAVVALGSGLLSNYAKKQEMKEEIRKEVEKEYDKRNQTEEES